MTDTARPLALTRLRRDIETPFEIVPTPPVREALARSLDILGVRKLRFAGRLVPEGAQDWRLEAMLGATVVQACVVTTDPVNTRLDEPVRRRYVAGFVEPETEEDEMPEDETLEPLPESLDLDAVVAEALALALPLYPRRPGADLGEAVFAAPGVKPMTDEDAKPLAGLAALRDRLADADPDDGAGGNDGPA